MKIYGYAVHKDGKRMRGYREGIEPDIPGGFMFLRMDHELTGMTHILNREEWTWKPDSRVDQWSMDMGLSRDEMQAQRPVNRERVDAYKRDMVDILEDDMDMGLHVAMNLAPVGAQVRSTGKGGYSYTKRSDNRWYPDWHVGETGGFEPKEFPVGNFVLEGIAVPEWVTKLDRIKDAVREAEEGHYSRVLRNKILDILEDES